MGMTTIAQYRGMLRVNKLRLDDELEIQAETQDRISQEVVVLNSRALEAKEELARVEARLTMDVKGGEDKLTKDEAEARVRRSPDRIKAWDRWQALRAAHEEWSGLLDAWKVKGFTLRDLGALYGADYFSMTKTSISYGDGAAASVRRDVERSVSRAAIREASERADEDRGSAPRRRTLID